MVIVAYSQLKEARNERSNTEDAKNKAIAARNIAIKAADRVELSEQRIDVLMKYAEVATWTFWGNKPFKGLALPTPVEGWTEGYITKKGDEYEFKCAPEALKYYKSMLVKYPYFPHPLQPLIRCLKAQGNETWRDYAEKAVDMLEKIVMLPNRDSAYDDMLADIRLRLEKSDETETP